MAEVFAACWWGPYWVDMGGVAHGETVYTWEVWANDRDKRPVLIAFFRSEEDADAFAAASNREVLRMAQAEARLSLNGASTR